MSGLDLESTPGCTVVDMSNPNTTTAALGLSIGEVAQQTGIPIETFANVNADAWYFNEAANGAIGSMTGRRIRHRTAKADYLGRMIPGLPAMANNLGKTGTDTSGRGSAQRWLSATGVKVTPVIPAGAELERTYKKQAAINKRMASR